MDPSTRRTLESRYEPYKCLVFEIPPMGKTGDILVIWSAIRSHFTS